MNEIKIFENEQFGQIRTTGTPDEPLFCLADVCKVLDLQPSRVKDRLSCGVISSNPIVDSLGRQQLATFVNEDGLYDVILDSRKPEAKAFRKWVTSEILPSIRKHGAYMTDEIIERTLTDPDYLIRLATELKNERQKRLLAENDAKLKQRQLDEQQPKVEFYDAVTESEGSETFELTAKSIKNDVLKVPKFGQKNLVKILREMNVIFGKGREIRPYQKYVDSGYLELVNYPYTRYGKTYIGLQTMVTRRGKPFVAKIVKQYYAEKRNRDNGLIQLSLFDNI